MMISLRKNCLEFLVEVEFYSFIVESWHISVIMWLHHKQCKMCSWKNVDVHFSTTQNRNYTIICKESDEWIFRCRNVNLPQFVYGHSVIHGLPYANGMKCVISNGSWRTTKFIQFLRFWLRRLFHLIYIRYTISFELLCSICFPYFWHSFVTLLVASCAHAHYHVNGIAFLKQKFQPNEFNECWSLAIL